MVASNNLAPLPIDRLRVKSLTAADIRAAFKAGLRDFTRRPFVSMFFGLVYVVIGAVFIAGLVIYDQIWMVVPAGVGFPLIAPFIAAGLYEMSRRFQAGQDFSAGEIFTVIFRQQRREFGWMAFVMLFVFWVWIYQVRLLLALFLQWESFSTLADFTTIISTTTNGMLFLGVGTLVGAFISAVLFTITVIAMPLLLDEEIDFVSAMLVSIKTVHTNAAVMLGWGAVIAILVFTAILPAMAGLIIVLPVLGHATWHVYRAAIEKVEPPAD